MKSFLPRVALTCLTLGVCSAGFSQDPVPIEFYRPLKNSVSIGVRMIGGNAKVGFSNLGNLSAPTNSRTTGVYDNGSWSADSQRTTESNAQTVYGEFGTGAVADADPNDTDATTRTWSERTYSANGRRYTIVNHVRYTNNADSTKNYTTSQIIGDYVNYDTALQTGSTRGWSFNSPSQVGGADGATYVDMSNYSTTSTGDTAQAESDSSAGVELQFSHIFKRYKRFEWGLNFSAGAANINAKTRGTIRSRLNKTTDRYFLEPADSRGASVDPSDFPNWWFTSSDANAVSDTVQTVVTGAATATDYTYAIENYRYLNYASPNSLGTSDVGVATVSGYWQIKGAYYMLRLGPVVRFPVSKNWTISVGAGAAGAFVGTKFTVDEYISLEDVAGNPIRYQSSVNEKQSTTEEKRFLPGFYADVNIERWLTVRTGVYVGYGYEKLGDYTQHVGGRSAKVDLGADGGFRFGIITRF